MYKQRFKPPNDFHTPKRNYLHIGYIATRPRSMRTENGEHALFGKYAIPNACEDKDWQDTARYVRKLSERKVNIYRSIISFERGNADELGLRTQKDWQRYCEQHIRILAEKNGIKIENLGWCGAYHNEGSHPHAHIVFWDNAQTVMENYTNPKIPDEIRIALIKSTYAEKIKEFIEQKTKAKADISELSNEQLADFDDYMKRIRPKEYAAFNEKLERYGFDIDKINISQLFHDEGQLAALAEDLFKLRAVLPKTGRISYKLLPVDIKSEIDSLTSKLLAGNNYLRNAVNKYVEAQVNFKKLYISNPDHLNEYRDKCEADAKKLIGNRIIKSVRNIISKEYESKNAEYTERQKQYFAIEFMRELLLFFAQGAVEYNAMREDKTGPGGELSERALKEYYLQHKDRGMEL